MISRSRGSRLLWVGRETPGRCLCYDLESDQPRACVRKVRTSRTCLPSLARRTQIHLQVTHDAMRPLSQQHDMTTTFASIHGYTRHHISHVYALPLPSTEQDLYYPAHRSVLTPLLCSSCMRGGWCRISRAVVQVRYLLATATQHNQGGTKEAASTCPALARYLRSHQSCEITSTTL